MPSSSSTHHSQASKQYYTLSDSKRDEKAGSQEDWQEPYTIDDEDLMFDGKPLNLLYEENRWQAEHHTVQYYRDENSRGRSRQSRK